MISRIRVLAAAVAITSTFAGFGQAAGALGKHAPKPPKVQHQARKNSNLYAYLAPKKQKKASGYYQSTLGGQMVYGKKK